VIELCPLPTAGGVTGVALRGKIEALVIGVGCLQIVREVTARAIHGSARKTPIDMAG
jgi:hypothetical protein